MRLEDLLAPGGECEQAFLVVGRADELCGERQAVGRECDRDGDRGEAEVAPGDVAGGIACGGVEWGGAECGGGEEGVDGLEERFKGGACLGLMLPGGSVVCGFDLEAFLDEGAHVRGVIFRRLMIF